MFFRGEQLSQVLHVVLWTAQGAQLAVLENAVAN
jgi:hypothetical protein